MVETDSAFVVSLDFELEWGVRDAASLEGYRPNLRGERDAVAAILDRFVTRGIHATWATVGFLFFRTREELYEYLPEHRPRYSERALDPYFTLSSDLGVDETADPFHFAASLVGVIGEAPGQEIGSHTFSHYYCLEEGQDARAFRADLEAARSIARARGLTLTSLVFPRNQVREDYLAVCHEVGLSTFRGNPRSRLYEARPGVGETPLRRMGRLIDAYLPLTGNNVGRVEQSAAGLRNVPASRFLRPYSRRLRMLEPLRLRRILRGLDVAARKGGIYHLWWHPHNFGTHLAENMAFLDQVLSHVVQLRSTHGMRSLNMSEVASTMTT